MPRGVGFLMVGPSQPHPAWVSISPGQEAIISARDGGGRVMRGKGQGVEPEGGTGEEAMSWSR